MQQDAKEWMETGVGNKDSRVRVLLAIPELLLRCGLIEWLSRVSEIDVVGEASNASQTLDALETSPPDVMILSPRIGSAGFSEVCSAVRNRAPACRIVLLVVDEHRDIVLAAAKEGVRGVLRLDLSSDHAAAAIRSVHRGELYFSKKAMQCIVEDYAASCQLAAVAEVQASPLTASNGDDAGSQPVKTSEADRTSKVERLSKRETQVLASVARGMTSRAIAEHLGISTRTVEAHRARVCDKLGIRTVAGLTRFALKMGLM